MRINDNIELRWENMRAGIQQQAEWLLDGPRVLLEAARARIQRPPPTHVYLVGCGDSHYAGVSARQAFEHWSGIPTEALPSLEFSRYRAAFAQPGAWVICVSNSGRVVRTVEAANVARSRGLLTIAITFDQESSLASAADVLLNYQYADPGFGPGTLSYIASLTAIYVVALRVAEISGRPIAGQLETLCALAFASRATVELADSVTQDLAHDLPLEAKIDTVGGGPSFGTALFGRAKLIEAAQARGGAHELEEWAHEEFFCTAPGTITVVVTPPGASADRAIEQLDAAREIGALSVALCPVDSDATTKADVVLPVVGDTPEELSPLTYCIPLELLAYHLASSRGLTMLGFDDEHRKKLNFRQIYGV